MKTLQSFDFAGKKAIVRVDLNVPLDGNFAITDFTRVNAVIPTIKKILSGREVFVKTCCECSR